jgi:hypothetical protein
LQPNVRVLVIILEIEIMLTRGHQVVFQEYFQNTNEGQMVSRLSIEVGHRFWLQSPLNHLGGKRQTSYIIAIVCNLKLLHV